MTEERGGYLLEVVRAAARARSVARREMRERVLRQRQRLAGTLPDSPGSGPATPLSRRAWAS